MRLLSLLLFPLALPAATYFPPPDSQGGWRTPKDAAEARALAGVDTAQLERAFAATMRSGS
ncbi:MAG: hypothetical protein RL250_1570, partial [Verrucomicrobiota bacterium]